MSERDSKFHRFLVFLKFDHDGDDHVDSSKNLNHCKQLIFDRFLGN